MQFVYSYIILHSTYICNAVQEIVFTCVLSISLSVKRKRWCTLLIHPVLNEGGTWDKSCTTMPMRHIWIRLEMEEVVYKWPNSHLLILLLRLLSDEMGMMWCWLVYMYRYIPDDGPALAQLWSLAKYYCFLTFLHQHWLIPKIEMKRTVYAVIKSSAQQPRHIRMNVSFW